MPDHTHELADTTFAVIDCEATGLNLEQDRPVEAAVVLLHPDGSVEPTLETLIDPRIPIPATASAIHHLVDDDVYGAPSLADIQPELTATGDAFAAHNAPYDRTMLGLTHTANPWICTWRLAMHLWPQAPAHGNQVLRYWLHLDVPQAKGLPAHRAMADALVTAAVLRQGLLELHSREDAPESAEALAEWIARPAELQHVPFGKHRGRPWKDMDCGFLEWVLERDFSVDVRHTAALWLERQRIV
ncbi:exonuclease domain-containing protein [Acidihalobacter ferrooxydans]|uniref:Exonuclease domain-containing protein n=1 Tax=Acidihalobacter ferrooxydans TaxID=1765967 RepID=A0A1P8UL68_9GAMM|nr:exonuclease domain-containing protein [Acidihalobacter ferrooxydans]APZ44555.1 hypothetical protein BW247_05340 [Acidihalobacter ferrooxydans]